MQTGIKNVAIVDYGMGNLFSVKNACEYFGIHAFLTHSKADILNADAVILPGVGAFGDAMKVLNGLDLIGPLREVAAMGKPLMGICLGMQLLMTESQEFGCHRGLDIVGGEVVRFKGHRTDDCLCKVPQVGWNRIYAASGRSWDQTPLQGLCDGEFLYFVHSYYVRPVAQEVALSNSVYDNTTFCSSLRLNNVFGYQFHPEKSGKTGLKILRQFLEVSV